MDTPIDTPVVAEKPVQKLPRAKELIMRTWEIFEKNWKKLVLVVVIGVLPLYIFMAGVFGIIVLTAPAHRMLAAIIGVVLGLVFLYGIFWAYATLVGAIILAVEGQPISIKSLFLSSRKKIWKFSLTYILYALVVLAGVILLLVPGFIWGIWFCSCVCIVIKEDCSPIESFKRSRRYVRGRFWAVFGRLCILGLIGMGLSLALQLVTGFFLSSIPFAGDIINTIFSNLFWVIFSLIYAYVLYLEMKKASDATPQEQSIS